MLMDAGYGNDTGLRTDITALGLRYVAGSVPHLGVAAGRGSPAAAVSNRSRTAADAAAARTAPADLGQDTRPQPAAGGVATISWRDSFPTFGYTRLSSVRRWTCD